MNDTEKQRLALTLAVADTLEEFGSANEGLIYSALMARGCNFATFMLIMASLARIGCITRANHVATHVRPIRECVPELAPIPKNRS